ncbi:Uncharacterised protein [Mycobacteroides abscessus subsp. abscessus]|nr:Uncharacterised protein [Mycobacteroides abscessus subsp. abscessus]
MRALFFQICTSCSKPALIQSPSVMAAASASSSDSPADFFTMIPYCSTKEFASIG